MLRLLPTPPPQPTPVPCCATHANGSAKEPMGHSTLEIVALTSSSLVTAFIASMVANTTGGLWAKAARTRTTRDGRSPFIRMILNRSCRTDTTEAVVRQALQRVGRGPS